MVNTDKLTGNTREYAISCYLACYDSPDQLLEAITFKAADKADCKKWKITPTQWRVAIKAALGDIIQDYKENQNVD